MSSTPEFENPLLSNDAIKPLAKFAHHPPTPPAEADDVQAELCERSNPIKKQRNDFLKYTAKYACNTFSEMAERLSKEFADLTNSRPVVPEMPMITYAEVDTDGTRFARSKGRIDNLTIGMMDGLATRQQYFRQEGQNKWFKKRSEKLLRESWETSVDIMMEKLKRGLECLNCEKHHETVKLFKEIDELRTRLKKMDANNIAQDSLNDIRAEAARVGDFHVLEVWASKCKNHRKMWEEKISVVQKRDREDSAEDESA